jgi:N-acetylglucosaminyl-diphospho-decaprenol L-rhamnosyltransferase
VIDAVGLLDERFFMYFEDVDWCRRIRAAGWRIVYLGEVGIVHGWAQSAAKQGLASSHDMLHRSRCLYFRKHHGFFGSTAVCLISSAVNRAFAFRYRKL